MNILVKFHQEETFFDEIRGHLLILPFYRALLRASEGLLREKAIKFEVEVYGGPWLPSGYCLHSLIVGKQFASQE